MTRRRDGGAARGPAASGQALPEFALVLPVFLLVLFGIVQAGLLFASDVAFTNAARDVARAASTYRVGGPAAAADACPKVGDQLRADLAHGLPGYSAARLQGTVTYGQVDGPAGSVPMTVVTIAGDYAQPLVIPLVGAILDRVDGVGAPAWAPAGDTLVLHATESMRLEGSEGGTSVTCAL